VRRRGAAVITCVLLAAGCGSSGADDGDSAHTPRAVAGQQKTGDADHRPGASPSTSVAAPLDGASTSPPSARQAAPPPGSSTAGGPADASAGGGNSSAITPGTTSTSRPPARAPQLPAYRAQDFYHWRWSPGSRSAVPWRFTDSVPASWRTPISQAAASWNAEQRSLQYAHPGSDLPAYRAQGCGGQQLENNGVHRAALDGPSGIVATTFACIDTSTAQAVSIQIVVDAAERWFTGAGPSLPGEYDLLGAVAHEFGHATGWEGHYAAHDPRCADTAHAERMCPALAPGSTGWRVTGVTDRSIFDSAY
jgi:hypothetical protein